VKLRVELVLDPIDAEHWKLTPDVDRFQWDGKKQDRLFWIQPRKAEALTRETAPRIQVRMESPFGRIVQGTSLRVTFAKDGTTTRRDRI
jgi:hypothetical protein